MNILSSFKSVVHKIRELRGEDRIGYLLDVFRIALDWSLFAFHRPRRAFSVQGQVYNYFHHPYHLTWANERGVEIPVVWEIVREFKERRVLEVGKVLSHYFPVNHDIVDKYEEARGVINLDIVDYRPSVGYDLIISISTLEHIGWDESPKEPEKVLDAINHLKAIVRPGGMIVVTVPIGYNSALDQILREGRVTFDMQICLKRISWRNVWVETDWNDIRDLDYGRPFTGANGLLVGVLRKS